VLFNPGGTRAPLRLIVSTWASRLNPTPAPICPSAAPSRP
jgi:hypothetical protein